MQVEVIQRRIDVVEQFLEAWSKYCDLVEGLFLHGDTLNGSGDEGPLFLLELPPIRDRDSADRKLRRLHRLVDETVAGFAPEMVERYGKHWTPPIELQIENARLGLVRIRSIQDIERERLSDVSDAASWVSRISDTSPFQKQRDRFDGEASDYRRALITMLQTPTPVKPRPARKHARGKGGIVVDGLVIKYRGRVANLHDDAATLLRAVTAKGDFIRYEDNGGIPFMPVSTTYGVLCWRRLRSLCCRCASRLWLQAPTTRRIQTRRSKWPPRSNR